MEGPALIDAVKSANTGEIATAPGCQLTYKVRVKGMRVQDIWSKAGSYLGNFDNRLPYIARQSFKSQTPSANARAGLHLVLTAQGDDPDGVPAGGQILAEVANH